MSPETTKSEPRSRGFHLVAAVLLGAVTVGGIFVGIQSILELPQVPYNARELFPAAHPRVSAAVFSVLLVWLGLGPAWVGDFLIRRPRQLPFLPLWATAIGLVSWVMLRFAVPHESLGDILGWPTLTLTALAGVVASYSVHPRFVTIFLIPDDLSQRHRSASSSSGGKP